MKANWITAGILGWSFLLASPQLHGQAIVEYGKSVGGVRRPPVRGANPMKPASRGSDRVGTAGSSGESSAVPTTTVLSVKTDNVRLYSRQDEYSEPVAQLQPNEKLNVLGQAFSDNGTWYMVTTEKGLVGWVNGSGVEAAAEGQPVQDTKSGSATRKK